MLITPCLLNKKIPDIRNYLTLLIVTGFLSVCGVSFSQNTEKDIAFLKDSISSDSTKNHIQFEQKYTVSLNDTNFNVSPVQWTREPVASGVIWFSAQFDELFGWPQHVNILAVNTNNPDVIIHPVKAENGCETTSSMGNRTNAIGGVNGGFFCLGYGSLCKDTGVLCPEGCEGRSLLKIDNELLSTNCVTPTYTARTSFGIYDQNNIVIRPIGPDAGWPQVTEALGAGPNLVSQSPNGPVINVSEEGFPWMNETAPRTSIGTTSDGILFIVTFDGRDSLRAEGVTIPELAQFMFLLGVGSAMNLDGGGSTTMYIQNQGKNGLVSVPSDPTGERQVYDGVFIYSEPLEETINK